MMEFDHSQEPWKFENKPGAFFCPYGNKGPACRCSCPDHCEHVWDGPTWTYDDGRAQSSTCSVCGMVRMDHDMWAMP